MIKYLPISLLVLVCAWTIMPVQKQMQVTLTAYCPGRCCNGKWAGKTAYGHPMKYYIDRDINICAVDKKFIRVGSKILYEGKKYLAIDCGVFGKHVDLFFRTHAETCEFGRRKNQDVVVIDPE